MRKLSCAASCILVLGCAVSACGQTLNFNPKSLVVPTFSTTFAVDLQINSPAVKNGSIIFEYDPLFLRLDGIADGPFVAANHGTSFYTSGTGAEAINLIFGPAGAADYSLGGNLAHLNFTVLSGFLSSPTTIIRLNAGNVNLFAPSNNRIPFRTNNLLVLHMEAVPEPGTYTFTLVLMAGLCVWGIRHRKREVAGLLT